MKCGNHRSCAALAAHALKGCALATLGLAAATVSAAGLELVGVMQNPTASYVALRNDPAAPVAWVQVGGRFGDYVVAHFEPATDTVTLILGAERREVSLRKTRVQSAESGPDAALATAVSVPAVRGNLDALTSAAWQHFWDTETTRATTADFVGPGRAVHRIESAVGEDYSTLRFTLNAGGSVGVASADGATVSSGKGEPVSIWVTAGTKLDAVSRRLGLSMSRLGELNPGFDAETFTEAMHRVRVQ